MSEVYADIIKDKLVNGLKATHVVSSTGIAWYMIYPYPCVCV